MALKRIIPQDLALARTLDLVNRRLQDALLDDPAATGQKAQRLQADRASIKTRQQPSA